MKKVSLSENNENFACELFIKLALIAKIGLFFWTNVISNSIVMEQKCPIKKILAGLKSGFSLPILFRLKCK